MAAPLLCFLHGVVDDAVAPEELTVLVLLQRLRRREVEPLRRRGRRHFRQVVQRRRRRRSRRPRFVGGGVDARLGQRGLGVSLEEPGVAVLVGEDARVLADRQVGAAEGVLADVRRRAEGNPSNLGMPGKRPIFDTCGARRAASNRRVALGGRGERENGGVRRLLGDQVSQFVRNRVDFWTGVYFGSVLSIDSRRQIALRRTWVGVGWWR